MGDAPIATGENMQVIETKLAITGKLPRRFPKRVSAGDLSEKIRNRLIDLMAWHECSDRAAEAAQKEFPQFRITGKTVSDVMILHTLRKPPVREMQLSAGIRRSA